MNVGAPTSVGVAGLAAEEALIVRIRRDWDCAASSPASAVSVAGVSESGTTCSSAAVGEVVTTCATSCSVTSVPSVSARICSAETAPIHPASVPATASPLSGSSAASRGNHELHSPARSRPRTCTSGASMPSGQVTPTMVAGCSARSRACAPSTSTSGTSASGTSTMRVSPSVTEGSASAGADPSTTAPAGTAAAVAANSVRREREKGDEVSVAGVGRRWDMGNSSGKRRCGGARAHARRWHAARPEDTAPLGHLSPPRATGLGAPGNDLTNGGDARLCPQ